MKTLTATPTIRTVTIFLRATHAAKVGPNVFCELLEGYTWCTWCARCKGEFAVKTFSVGAMLRARPA